jgi:tetratricopeptide (TPR) repeat protein
MKRLAVVLLALIFCAYFFYEVDRRRQAAAPPPRLMLLPSKEMTKVVSFGNEILTAQLIFYNSMFFVGSLEKPPPLTTLRELYHTLDTVTYLDPYNLDGYYFANGLLSWNPSLLEPLNKLLLRGMAHRPWDWQLPFFYGFNQFYFLKKPKEAAVYFERAYQLNPKNTFLPTFIARLYYQANATETAIAYLKEMLRTTENEKLRGFLLVRLEALQAVSKLEDAVKLYVHKYGTNPQRFEDLVDRGLLKEIPSDPYGGEFYLDEKGRVRSTSKFAYAHKRPRKKK